MGLSLKQEGLARSVLRIQVTGWSMAMDQRFESYFKPEVRSSGSKLVASEKVSISSGSDTSVHAFVKASPPVRVRLVSEDISSETLTAECSCPASTKGRLCKHIWATLLEAEQKYPDFLSSKIEIAQADLSLDPKRAAQEATRTAAKLRASDYRKDQYQKAKLRAKEFKQSRKRPEAEDPSHSEQSRLLNPDFLPPAVIAAFAYFTENGFPLLETPTDSALGEAKRKLSRVFHPDRGGSHEEIVELNRNCELLQGFLRQ